MQSEILSKIQVILIKYEKRKQRSIILGIVLGTISLLLGLFILKSYYDKSITIKIGALSGFIGAFTGILFRLGSNYKNNYVEEIKDLLNTDS